MTEISLHTPSSRRAFLGAATAASYSRVLGANERINIGFIGCGLIGLRHIADFKTAARRRPRPRSATSTSRASNTRRPLCGIEPQGLPGFPQAARRQERRRRRHLDPRPLARPADHHGLRGRQGRLCREADDAVRQGRPLDDDRRPQVQAHRASPARKGRSGPHIQEVQALLAQGNHVGKIHSVRFSSYRNIMPGFGRPADCDPPPGLDYDLWLGPAPKRPYNPNRVHLSLPLVLGLFRRPDDQSRRARPGPRPLPHCKVRAPKSVYSAGGRFALEDNGETPDTQDAIFEYPRLHRRRLHPRSSAAASGAAAARPAASPACSSAAPRAVSPSSRGGYEFVPDMKIAPESGDPAMVHAARPSARPPDFKPTPYARSQEGAGRFGRTDGPARAQLARLHQVPPAAHRRRRGRPPRLHRLPLSPTCP